MKKENIYYLAPDENIFQELKEGAINIWKTYSDEFGYSSEKINSIKDVKNVSDNFMFLVAMFDGQNQRLLSSILSEECKKEIRIRMEAGGMPKEYIHF